MIKRLGQSEQAYAELKKEKESLSAQSAKASEKSRELLDVIIPLGTALSAEKDLNQLFHKILVGARDICHADGGTIYIKNGSILEFKVIQNESLNIEWHDEDEHDEFPSLSIYDEQTGDVNENNVATLSASNGETVNIVDAYENNDFDFSGTKIFDKKMIIGLNPF